MRALLAVTIGNTRLGLGCFELPAPAHPRRPAWAAWLPLPRTRSFNPRLPPCEGVEAVVLASVNPQHSAAVTSWILRRFGLRPLTFPDDVRPPITNRCRPPGAVGADRLAAAVAAWSEFRSACIIIDAGTAVTVNAVSADGAFIGGAILPGAALAAEALAAGTALLPSVKARASPRAIGRSTRAAISSGTLRGLAGAVDRLVADFRRELPGAEHVVITGGDAGLLARFCRTPMCHRPSLVLCGLAVSYLSAART